MVVFLDLEDEAEPPEQYTRQWMMQQHEESSGMKGLSLADDARAADLARANPNKEKPVTEALACYPVIMSIASHIDLNTLDALSTTCRQVRVNLLQFRTQLISSTLHCENEDVELDPEHTLRYRARAADWYFVEGGLVGSSAGKFGDCARDMVDGCRRCDRTVCRNCAIKPPAPILLKHRHRRLCRACSRAPLSSIISHEPALSSQELSFSPHEVISPAPVNLNVETIMQEVCRCPAGVWLCQPCGRSLGSSDQEYEGIWKWRTRYMPSLGGLGVGFGDADRGVPCGRGVDCLAAREVEEETDCDAEDAREIDRNSRAASPASSPGSANGSIHSASSQTQLGPGYARHEIEGIGGRLKKKLVRMVKVGACVPEWEDEKSMGKYLVREQDGRARSLCGWCWRIVPCAKDVMG